MEVLSPVGRFPLRMRRPRLFNGQLLVPAEMGAWRSEVRIGVEDAPLIGVGLASLALAFWLGRVGRRTD